MTDDSSLQPTRLSIRLPYYLLSFWMRIMPSHGIAQALIAPWLYLVYFFAGKARRISWNNLVTAFGNQDMSQSYKEIIRRSFFHFSRSMLGVLYYGYHPYETDQAMVLDEDVKASIDQGLARGKGLVVLTGHLGYFPLMLFRLARAGYKVNAIVNPGRDYGVQDHLWKGATRCGVRLIASLPARQCIQSSIQALRNNEILVIVPDQNFGGNNRVFVHFFEKLSGTTSSPAIFSMRTGAPVLPLFAVYENERCRIVKDDMIMPPETEMTASVIREYMQRMISVIERFVRDFPEQYMWMHNRWKTKPNDKELKELEALGVIRSTSKEITE